MAEGYRNIGSRAGDTRQPALQKNRGAGLVPKARKDCVNCGLCAEKCPAQVISRENLKTADAPKCISCMRCVVKCPKSARKVNGAMVSVVALAIKKACSERKGNEADKKAKSRSKLKQHEQQFVKKKYLTPVSFCSKIHKVEKVCR